MSYITKIVTSNYSTDIFLSRKKEKKAAIQKRDYYKKGLLQKGAITKRGYYKKGSVLTLPFFGICISITTQLGICGEIY